jgi:hypothetical protein
VSQSQRDRGLINRNLEWATDSHIAAGVATANGNGLEETYIWSILNKIISESDNINDPMRSDSYLPLDWNEKFGVDAESLQKLRISATGLSSCRKLVSTNVQIYNLAQ